jgi:hypothetical protein
MTARSISRVTREYERVLTDVFELMLACGLLRKDILRIVARAVYRARKTRNCVGKDMSGYLATAALVLDAWHRNRRYLNSKAEPKAIRLLGPCPSVEALVRSEAAQPKPQALARRLKVQRLVVPCAGGLYKPASNVALLSAFDPLAIQHVSRSLSMLLDTIRRNLAFPNPAQRLIERIAEVPDLPLEQIPAFRKFTQIQGWTLLRTVNDWLESRRARIPSRSGRTVRAGMHVHSYIDAVARLHRPAR